MTLLSTVPSKKSGAGLKCFLVSFFSQAPVWVWILPIACRSFFYLQYLAGYTPDSFRYIKQAESLMSGRGYPSFDSLGAPLASAPPPGYPIFIAAVYTIAHSDVLLRLCHLALSIVSCYLVYFSLKPRNSGVAYIALVAFAISPWTGRIMMCVLSEPLSIFLSSCVVYCLSRFELETEGPLLSIFGGLSISSLMLTAPATVPLGFALLTYLLWKKRKKKQLMTMLFLAWLAPMIPWQLDCYHRTGRIQPTIYYLLPNSAFTRGFTQWFRTWSTGTDLSYIFGGANSLLRNAPRLAFSSEGERNKVLQWSADVVNAKISSEEYDRLLSNLAHERVRQNRFQNYFVLPFKRAVALWSDVGPVWRWGIEKATIASLFDQVKQGILHVLFYWLPSVFLVLIYHSQNLFWCYLASLSLASRRWLPLLMICAVLFYTCLTAFTALCEERRNYSFYPFLFFLGWWSKPRFAKTRLLYRTQGLIYGR